MMNMTTLDAGVEQVPFADLSLSDLNPRTVVSEDDIAVLADNIAQVGLIQNLAGLRRKDGGVEIVAGGRRNRALRRLQDDPQFQSVPVLVTDDPETARYWASSENHLRTQPHPADEIKEYGAMRAAGIDNHAIAIAFGVTEAQHFDAAANFLNRLVSIDFERHFTTAAQAFVSGDYDLAVATFDTVGKAVRRETTEDD